MSPQYNLCSLKPQIHSEWGILSHTFFKLKVYIEADKKTHRLACVVGLVNFGAVTRKEPRPT